MFGGFDEGPMLGIARKIVRSTTMARVTFALGGHDALGA
jgi:hypothetical protein